MPTYYTPTVEDLVWGLEFIIEDENDEDIKTDFIINHITKFEYANNFLNFLPSKIWVKHLDEDDIIELGWDIGKGAFKIKDYRLFKHIDGTIEISEIRNDRLKTIYYGKCSNKAELKRLMNNLQITK